MAGKGYMHLEHAIPPVYDRESNVLILGSFPSVKSREEGFFYGNPRNRFWKVIKAVLTGPNRNGYKIPYAKEMLVDDPSIEEKKSFLLQNHVAVWDVIKSCDIKGSSDSSIKNVEPNNIADIIHGSRIDRIFLNGETAYRLYKKYVEPDLRSENIKVYSTKLPSTSPANAAFTLEMLINAWDVIRY